MSGGVRVAAVAGGLVLAGGLLAGTAGVAIGHPAVSATVPVRVGLAYACRFPSGGYHVGVTVTATVPPTVVAGQQVDPASVAITARLPHAAVADLSKLGGVTVSGSQALTVIEASAGQAVPVQWTAQAASARAIPATGNLTLATSGTAPPVTVGSPGTLTFTAGSLALALSPVRSDGSATDPATVHVSCTMKTAAPATLAVVQVISASPTPSASATPSATPSSPSSPPPGSGVRAPKGCAEIKVKGTGVPTCGYITGYSDVAKLYGAALLQSSPSARPALVNLDFAERHVIEHRKHELIEYSTAELYYHGLHELPPVRATFLAFRFIPVTATLHITELAPIKIVSVSGIAAPPYPILVRATTKISIAISDVLVNGVPLDIGPRCRPASSVPLTLTGRGDNTIPPKGYTVPTGGPLTGRLTIPPFVECGVGENLDPLLTGSISGPGNFVKMTQGKLCGPSQPANWVCPPPVPRARH